jgi:uncharacterized protein YndB with AHSA1/START domain
MKNETPIEHTSDREILVTRTINGPARLVWEAWTKADLFKQWWVPKSMNMQLLSCEVDARAGGTYRLDFGLDPTDPSKTMAFFGKYIEVTAPSRLVWTNEESGPNGSVTTLTLEDKPDGKTLVTVRELYPSKEALVAAGGAEEGFVESLQQLEDFIATRK